LLYGVGDLYLLWIQFQVRYQQREKYLEGKINLSLPKKLPKVTVQLPIYNEGSIVDELLYSITKLDYPNNLLHIQVLDDSDDGNEARTTALVDYYTKAGYDIDYIYRLKRDGFKAGALKNGIRSAKGDYIAIFDADFKPQTDFLMKVLPYFFEDHIACVQSRWGHINEDFSNLTRAQAVMLDGHFGVEQSARNKSGLFLNFNGTAGVWRKKAIIDSGNWEGDTLTEDLDLSYRSQLRGWRIEYLSNYYTGAELPITLEDFARQQYRWCKGSVETALKILPRLLKNKLSVKQKIFALHHLTGNLLYPITLLIVLLFPLVALSAGVLSESGLTSFSAFFTGMTAISLLTLLFYRSGRRSGRLQSLVYLRFLSLVIGLSIRNTIGVVEAMLGKKSPFERTPKDYKDKDVKRKIYSVKDNYIHSLELLVVLYLILMSISSIYWEQWSPLVLSLLSVFGFGMMCWNWVIHHMRSLWSKRVGPFFSVIIKSTSREGDVLRFSRNK